MILTHKEIGNLRLARLELNSVNKGNSLGLVEARALAQHLKKLDCDGLLLTHEGKRFFCTGGDLRDQKISKREKSLNTQKLIRQNLAKIAKLPVPTVALLKGDAFGGGVE